MLAAASTVTCLLAFAAAALALRWMTGVYAAPRCCCLHPPPVQCRSAAGHRQHSDCRPCSDVPRPAGFMVPRASCCVLTRLLDAFRRGAGAVGGVESRRPLAGTAVRLLLDQGGAFTRRQPNVPLMFSPTLKWKSSSTPLKPTPGSDPVSQLHACHRWYLCTRSAFRFTARH